MFSIGKERVGSARFYGACLKHAIIVAEHDPTLSPVEKAQRKASLVMEVVSTSGSTPGVATSTFSGLNGSSALFPGFTERLDSVGKAFTTAARATRCRFR